MKLKINIFIFFVAITSCKRDENTNLIKKTESVVSTENIALSYTAIAYDILSKENFKDSTLIFLHPEQKIIFSDSNLIDSNAIGNIFLGEKTSLYPNGLKGFDFYNRYGNIQVTVLSVLQHKDFIELNFDNDSNWIYTNKLSLIKGKIRLIKNEFNRYTLKLINFCAKNDANTILNGEMELYLKNENGQLSNNTIIALGNIFTNFNNMENETLYTHTPLNYSLLDGCSFCITEGIQKYENNTILFDIFNNKACDATCKINIKNKEYFYNFR